MVEQIRRRLAAYRPSVVDDPRVARASVAMVLAELRGEVNLLLIERAMRAGDPWSGHMAFPGGRRDPDDADVVQTAIRETHEEVGIDLRADGEVVGRLDELRAVSHNRPLDLVISPIVFTLSRTVVMRPDPREVESAVWVPLAFFRSPESAGVHRRTLDGVENQYPAYLFQQYTIWGLTHRILDGFLTLIENP